MRSQRIGFLSLWFFVFPAFGFAQAGWGTLAAKSGEHGVWIPPNAGDERLVELDSTSTAPVNAFAIETNPLQRTPRAATPSVASFKKLKVGEIPFQPWARALYDYRPDESIRAAHAMQTVRGSTAVPDAIRSGLRRTARSQARADRGYRRTPYVASH
jgi:hypothetical protein